MERGERITQRIEVSGERWETTKSPIRLSWTHYNIIQLRGTDAIYTVANSNDGIEAVELRQVVFPSEAVAEIFSVTVSFSSSPLAKMFFK